MSKVFLSIREFSEITGLSVSMTRKNINSGRLKAVRQNGLASNWLIPSSEVETWPKRKLKANRVVNHV